MANDSAAVQALVDGYARGVQRALAADRPDLAWEVTVDSAEPVPERGPREDDDA